MPNQVHKIPGLVTTDHEFLVPLDHAQPSGEKIKVFAREVTSPDKVGQADLPWLVFLQGGPGFSSPRPSGAHGWIGRAIKDYRVLLLDQRGTGLSTPVATQTLARRGGAEAQAEYLTHFRADSIVKDCEWIRKELAGGKPWSLLGQSYGGFCITTYLSFAPEGVKEAIITGGIPPVGESVEAVYRATYRKVAKKNADYYARYPGDVERVKAIVAYLRAARVVLPGGGVLTPEHFLQIGIALGASDGFEEIHYLIEQAFVEGVSGRELSYAFLRGMENALHFDTNPIYALLHEPCYLEGEASQWAAERVLGEVPAFSLDATPVLFRGEMVYPWLFDAVPTLKPLKKTADLLATRRDWPKLYDPARLARNTVPVVAAVYQDDMYVDFDLAMATAQSMGGLKMWITNEYEHNGLRADGHRLLDRLLGMLHGTV